MVTSKFTPDQKIQIVPESIKTNIGTAELCRKHNVSPLTCYTWRQKFMDAGKASLGQHEKSNQIKFMKKENDSLKRLVREQVMALDILKKPWRKKVEGSKTTKQANEPTQVPQICRSLKMYVTLRVKATQHPT